MIALPEAYSHDTPDTQMNMYYARIGIKFEMDRAVKCLIALFNAERRNVPAVCHHRMYLLPYTIYMNSILSTI